jgi:hypothetical protein
MGKRKPQGLDWPSLHYYSPYNPSNNKMEGSEVLTMKKGRQGTQQVKKNNGGSKGKKKQPILDPALGPCFTLHITLLAEGVAARLDDEELDAALRAAVEPLFGAVEKCELYNKKAYAERPFTFIRLVHPLLPTTTDGTLATTGAAAVATAASSAPTSTGAPTTRAAAALPTSTTTTTSTSTSTSTTPNGLASLQAGLITVLGEDCAIKPRKQASGTRAGFSVCMCCKVLWRRGGLKR